MIGRSFDKASPHETLFPLLPSGEPDWRTCPPSGPPLAGRPAAEYQTTWSSVDVPDRALSMAEIGFYLCGAGQNQLDRREATPTRSGRRTVTKL